MTDHDKTGSFHCDNFTRTFSKEVHLGDALCLTPKLKSLEEFNRQRAALHADRNRPRPNGIACPECGYELVDTAPMQILTSDPPKKGVNCPGCGYSGFRVA